MSKMAPATGTSTSGANPSAAPNPGGYSVMLSEEDYHNTQSMEMTKFVREHFKTPKAPPYKLEKLLIRTSLTRVNERDPMLWQKHCKRRQDQLNRGFFTPNHKAYHSIGDIQLNSQRLILNSMADYLPKKLPLQSLTSRFGRRDHKLSPTKAEQVKTPVKDVTTKERVKELDLDEKLRERAQITSGFAYIQQRLEESEMLLKAERGGQSYEKCVKQLKEMKKRQCEMNKQKSQLTLVAPTMGTWSPLGSPSGSPGPTLEDRQDTERRAFERKRNLWLGKVRSILKIINALHNIKTRDLKSRVPLSHDQVKHMYRDVVWEKPAIISQSKPTRPVQTGMEATTRAHSSADTISSGEQAMLGHLKSSKPVLPAVNKSTLSMQGKSDVNQSPSPAPWKKFGYHGLARKGFRLERENRVDTWEDLITAQPPSSGKRNSMLPTLLSISHPANAVMRWHQNHMDHKQKQPYWMTVGVASDEKVKRPQANTSGSKPSVEVEPDAEATLEDIRQTFLKTQKKLAREALQDLERLDRDRQRVIKHKFQVITLSPLFEKTVFYLQSARAHQAGPVMTIDDSDEIKLSPWYMDLKASVEEVLGKHDTDVVNLFNKLSQFSLEDGKSIPNAKEKLCLLVMSMPASDLLTIPMQLAIVFVLEEILWAPPRALAQWLHHKKVPLIIDIDLQSTT
nr:uncharacterized protein LOC129280446 [Lytechinus pictus]